MVEKSVDFAIDIVNFYKWLCFERKEYVMSKQILRSGTSIGANIHEAIYVVSKKEFIAKMQIAMKEISETGYWLVVLDRTAFLPEEYYFLKGKCDELKWMMISALKTAKEN